MRYFCDEYYIEGRNEAANEARNINRLQLPKNRKSLYTLTA